MRCRISLFRIYLEAQWSISWLCKRDEKSFVVVCFCSGIIRSSNVDNVVFDAGQACHVFELRYIHSLTSVHTTSLLTASIDLTESITLHFCWHYLFYWKGVSVFTIQETGRPLFLPNVCAIIIAPGGSVSEWQVPTKECIQTPSSPERQLWIINSCAGSSLGIMGIYHGWGQWVDEGREEKPFTHAVVTKRVTGWYVKVW